MVLGKKVAQVAILAMISSGVVYAQDNRMCAENMPCMQNNDMRKGEMRDRFQGSDRPMGRKECKNSQRGDREGLGLFRGVEITDDQRHKIKIERSKLQTEMLEKMGNKNDRDMMDLFFTKDGFDQKGYVKLRADRAKLMAEIKAKHIQNVYNMLTPEQKAKFLENQGKQKDKK